MARVATIFHAQSFTFTYYDDIFLPFLSAFSVYIYSGTKTHIFISNNNFDIMNDYNLIQYTIYLV